MSCCLPSCPPPCFKPQGCCPVNCGPCKPCCNPCYCPRCCSRRCICKCAQCGCATCNGMQLCLKCSQKRASLTRRQCYLPRTSNPCIRPCSPPKCVDTYAGCRAYRAKYDVVRGANGCYPQLHPQRRMSTCL